MIEWVTHNGLSLSFFRLTRSLHGSVIETHLLSLFLSLVFSFSLKKQNKPFFLTFLSSALRFCVHLSVYCGGLFSLFLLPFNHTVYLHPRHLRLLHTFPFCFTLSFFLHYIITIISPLLGFLHRTILSSFFFIALRHLLQILFILPCPFLLSISSTLLSTFRAIQGFD